MLRTVLLTAAVSTLSLAGSADAALIIDTFTTPGMNGQVVMNNAMNSGPIISAMIGQPTIGGSREIFVEKTGQIGNGLQPIVASANQSGTEIFNFDQFSSSARGIARIVYDGNADGILNPTGFASPLNLFAFPNPGMTFEKIQVTGSGIRLTVNLYDATTGLLYSSGPQLVGNGYRGDLFVPYTSFTGPGGASTLSNVGAIEFVIDGSQASGSDLRIGVISTTAVVPEPTGIAIAATGMLLSCGFGWRRRRKAA